MKYPRPKKALRKAAWLASACLWTLSLSASALDQTPVVHLDVAGGQIFFKNYAGTSKSFPDTAVGSADWLFADGLKLSEKDTLLPSVSGQYLRRDQVNQIGGGGTLVSQTLDDAASLRWIHSLGPWLIKPNIAYKNELAVSLPQDGIGKGFFDMYQADAGLEAEWKGERVKSLRQSVSASKIRYYHYQVANSPLFGAELQLDDRNLDFVSYNYSLAADYALWQGGLLSGSASLSYADYAHQKRINPNSRNPSGFLLTSHDRGDWMGTWLLGLTQRWSFSWNDLPIEGAAGLTGGYVVLSSNQNNFDAFQSLSSLAQFNSNYYSYHEGSIGPLLSATAAKRWKSSLSYNYARRDYTGRPAQNPSGKYAGGKVHTDTHTVSYSLSYDLWKGLSAQLSGGYVSSSSNMHFENFYLYNYSFPYYFIGFGYSL